jgi:hypothetical protein
MLEKLLQECVADINKRIEKCNDPTNKYSNHMFAPIVLLAQRECDRILADTSKCTLERLLLCADAVNNYGGGNCMMQTYVAFAQLLKKMLAEQLITVHSTFFIAICTTSDHTFLMVNGIVCDPWANFVGALEDSPTAPKKLKYYFAITEQWYCYDEGYYDVESTAYTMTLVDKFAPNPAASEETEKEATGLAPMMIK